MKRGTELFKNYMLVLAILYALLGLVLLIWPLDAQIVIYWILAVGCMLYGVYCLLSYFTGKNLPGVLRYGLFVGVIFILLGLVLAIWSQGLIAAFGVVVGIAIIIDSIFRLQIAMEIKRKGGRRWFIMLILALALLVLGVVLLFNPVETAIAATRFAGVLLLINGLADLFGIIFASMLLKP